MGAVTIQQMADRVAALMEERLRIKGSTLSQKLRKGSGLLPRKVRAEARELARFSVMAQNPKLLMQVDESRVAEAYDICLRYLNTVSVWDRRRAALVNMVLSILGNLLVVAVVVVCILLWRGYL
jgi:hypothetical protein